MGKAYSYTLLAARRRTDIADISLGSGCGKGEIPKTAGSSSADTLLSICARGRHKQCRSHWGWMLSLIQYWKRYWEAIRSSNAGSLERDVQVERDGGGAMRLLGFYCSRHRCVHRRLGFRA